jgi:hypothetical protein
MHVDDLSGPYVKVWTDALRMEVWGEGIRVGRCRLTVSKPVLKAPIFSALETSIS